MHDRLLMHLPPCFHTTGTNTYWPCKSFLCFSSKAPPNMRLNPVSQKPWRAQVLGPHPRLFEWEPPRGEPRNLQLLRASRAVFSCALSLQAFPPDASSVVIISENLGMGPSSLGLYWYNSCSLEDQPLAFSCCWCLFFFLRYWFIKPPNFHPWNFHREYKPALSVSTIDKWAKTEPWWIQVIQVK